MGGKLIEIFVYTIIGIALILYSLHTLIKIIFYKKVRARCIGTISTSGRTVDDITNGYKSKFEFEYEGKIYKASESNWLGRKLKQGKDYSIYVNPKNPNVILTNAQICKNIFFLLFGVAIIIISFF